MATRTLAAVVGGYAATALITALLARHLPMARAEATMTATLASFGIYAAVLMTAFAVRRTATALVGLGATVALLGAALWLSFQLGGRA